jgi:hypothetical protein
MPAAARTSVPIIPDFCSAHRVIDHHFGSHGLIAQRRVSGDADLQLNVSRVVGRVITDGRIVPLRRPGEGLARTITVTGGLSEPDIKHPGGRAGSIATADDIIDRGDQIVCRLAVKLGGNVRAPFGLDRIEMAGQGMSPFGIPIDVDHDRADGLVECWLSGRVLRVGNSGNDADGVIAPADIQIEGGRLARHYVYDRRSIAKNR